MAAHSVAASGSPVTWALFAVPVVVLCAIDLGIFRQSNDATRGDEVEREPTLRSSLAWTGLWAAVAAVFGVALALSSGTGVGLSFFTAYVVEQALSIDNLFVFLLVFREMAVPAAARKRALAWGILGALVLRVAMLAVGGAVLARFHVVGLAMGALLVGMGVKSGIGLLRKPRGEDEGAPSGRIARLLGRWLPISDRFDGDRLSTEVGGRWFATPLLVVVLTILVADVVFALDSIPAVLAVSPSPLVVIPSNVLAVLGLRSMFFVVQGLLSRLRYLPHGLAAVLVIVGGKMLLDGVVEIPTAASLGSVLGALAIAVIASLRKKPEPPEIPVYESNV